MLSAECDENNKVLLSGKVHTLPEFGHNLYGEGFYHFDIEVKRLSTSSDIIPITISERLTDLENFKLGGYIEITGQYRSYNSSNNAATSKLMLTVFARDISFTEEEERETDVNFVELTGFICKVPTYRTTPFNREIADFLLAVNRSYNKSDYIPCIAWGRNARFCSKRRIGDNLRITGRLQSRTYQKKLEDGESIDKVAYEVSVSRFELLSDAPTDSPSL